MSVTVGQVLGYLNTIAPMNTAESYDNVGLLTGKLSGEHHRHSRLP